MDARLELTAEKMGEILTKLLEGGFEPPIILTAIGKNHSIMVAEYTPHEEGHLHCEVIAARTKDEAFTAPINMLFVDERGEAARVVLNASGGAKILPFRKR